jgi:hypothetical protein
MKIDLCYDVGHHSWPWGMDVVIGPMDLTSQLAPERIGNSKANFLESGPRRPRFVISLRSSNTRLRSGTCRTYILGEDAFYILNKG